MSRAGNFASAESSRPPDDLCCSADSGCQASSSLGGAAEHKMVHKSGSSMQPPVAMEGATQQDLAARPSKRVMRVLSVSRIPVVSHLGRTILTPAKASCAQYSSTLCVHSHDSHAWGSTSFWLGRVVDVRGASRDPRRMITANRRPSWNSNGQDQYYVIHQQHLANNPRIDLYFLYMRLTFYFTS